MLERPRQAKEAATKRQKPGRFRIQKLEERIAPKCQTNPHGKEVGCGRNGGGGGGGGYDYYK